MQTQKQWTRPVRLGLSALLAGLPASLLFADCTTTNLGLTPLNDLGFGVYRNFTGGLYPLGSNSRPPSHDNAGLEMALDQVRSRDAAGNVDTNGGQIVLLSIGMSNTTQEWASKGTGNFKRLADADPSKNPQLVLVDGAQGGQDAVQWTNFSAATWSNVLQRLASSGVSTAQVQVVWLKQALARPVNYGLFPAHARGLQDDLEQILRVAKQRFPNLAIAYLSSRTRAYTNGLQGLNPEPFAFESAYAVKWLIEKQMDGHLNFAPAQGPAVAPWLAWGPYLWTDGLRPRSDGLTWLCSDLESDFTHPSATGGVPKVARQLLAFFKTDPTATPWFLKRGGVGQPPLCSPSASTTNGLMPLAVTFAANASDPDGPIRDYQWTFGDGDFSTNANPIKVFPAPGTYPVRLTVTDANGNTALGRVAVNVTTTFDLWRRAKFTGVEITNATVSGPAADPDGDHISNRLEYLLGLEPKLPNSATNGLPKADIRDGYFALTFTRYKFASDLLLAVEFSEDLSTWRSGADVVETVAVIDNGPAETLTVRVRTPVALSRQGFLRLRAAPR